MAEHLPQSGAGVKGLPPCERYITTHDSNGTSRYDESPAQSFWSLGSNGACCRSYAIGEVPVNLAADEDIKAYKAKDGATSIHARDLVPSQPGANLIVVDINPGEVSAMHRTVSLDFSICVIGEIDHELEDGSVVRLRPGDHIVQRSTMHRWINPSKTQPARLIACLLPCVPLEINGQKLQEEWR